MTSLAQPSIVQTRVPLASFTSWLVGGAADFFAQPTTVEQLREVFLWAAHAQLPVSLLAGGTNVLVSDDGVRGLVISLRKLSGATTEIREGRLVIECLSGTSKSELLKLFLKNKLAPALFLAGLPGDVGGGVVMNAGVAEAVMPREFMEMVDAIEVMRPDGSLDTIERADLRVDYRHCDGWQPGIITSATLSWPLEPQPEILAAVKKANQVRLSKQPLDLPSCGSVFRNPPGTSAGRVVDGLGLKGFAIGGAKVSEKHANFIVNFNDATAMDLHLVIDHVREQAKLRAGIELKTEVVYLGEWLILKT